VIKITFGTNAVKLYRFCASNTIAVPKSLKKTVNVNKLFNAFSKANYYYNWYNIHKSRATGHFSTL